MFKGLWQLSWTEFKLNLREPEMLFWAIAFPTLWMGFFGALFDEPMPGSGYQGLSQANFLLPGGIGVVICASAFIGMAVTLSTYREQGVLRRLRATPIDTPTLALGFILSQSFFVALGVLVLFAVGILGFGTVVLGSPAILAGVAFLGMAAFLSLGGAIGSIARTPRAASLITMIIFMPMIFLSEMWMPISTFPEWLQPICRALPLTPLNTVLRDVVYGVPLEELWRLGILGGWLLVGALVTLRWFRWE